MCVSDAPPRPGQGTKPPAAVRVGCYVVMARRLLLSKSEARHQYQTLKGYSWYYKTTRERAYLGQYPSSTYIVPVGDEGTIYIDHFVVVDQLTPHPTDNSAMAQYCSSHMLTYTYYDYQINPEADTSSVVDF